MNDHLGFQIYYMGAGSRRGYVPDFLVRLAGGTILALEIKGTDRPQNNAKRDALNEWVKPSTRQAVSDDGHGTSRSSRATYRTSLQSKRLSPSQRNRARGSSNEQRSLFDPGLVFVVPLASKCSGWALAFISAFSACYTLYTEPAQSRGPENIGPEKPPPALVAQGPVLSPCRITL